MVRIKAHYDGKVLVPDEPLDVPRDVPLDVMVQPSGPMSGDELIQKFIGCGSDIWKGIDPAEYQRKEREGWT